MRNSKYTIGTLFIEILLIAFALMYCVPLYMVIAVSLKTAPDAYVSPMSFPVPPLWSNYLDAIGGSRAGSVSVVNALMNSLIITGGSVAAVIAISSIGAYALARQTSRLSTGVYLIFVMSLIIPSQLGLIPLFSAMRSAGLTGTIFGTTLLYTALVTPHSVFLYSSYVRALPRAYEEAALMDGASHFRLFIHVVLPLLLPVTGTIAVLMSILIWNDFLVQLIFLGGSGAATLPVAIYALASGNVAEWNIIFAVVVISLLPIMAFFVFAQKALIRGFTGGLKG